MHHTVVISDIHLWDAIPGDGLWMRYRQRRYFPDADLAAMLDNMVAEADRDALEVVFNGDLFDFDVAPVHGDDLRFGDPPRSPGVTIDRLGRILDDHPVFLRAVARVLAAGHRVVFVSGNHDAQLTWPTVREYLTDRIMHEVMAVERETPVDTAEARARVIFRAWFHHTADGIHVEHGNQYDRFCSFRYPMEPFTRDGRLIQPTVGSLVVRYLVGRLGYFNPNVDSTFDLTLWGYLRHFARYYLFSRHSLVATWMTGAARVAYHALRHSDRHDPKRAARNLDAAVEETGIDPVTLTTHQNLFMLSRPHEVARTLRTDRALLMALGVATAALGFALPRTALGVALGSVAGVAAFNVAVPSADLEQVYGDVARCMRAIARIHHVRAVVFGHTHLPHGDWEDGVFYGNCGTWSPRFRDAECTVPLEMGRPLVWLRSDEAGNLAGGLYRWHEGRLVAASCRELIEESHDEAIESHAQDHSGEWAVANDDEGDRRSVA